MWYNCITINIHKCIEVNFGCVILVSVKEISVKVFSSIASITVPQCFDIVYIYFAPMCIRQFRLHNCLSYKDTRDFVDFSYIMQVRITSHENWAFLHNQLPEVCGQKFINLNSISMHMLHRPPPPFISMTIQLHTPMLQLGLHPLLIEAPEGNLCKNIIYMLYKTASF